MDALRQSVSTIIEFFAGKTAAYQPDEGIQTVYQFAQGGATGNASFSMVSDPVYLGSSSLKMEIGTSDVNVDTPALNLDTTEYPYVYIWMYSPRKIEALSTINIQFWTNSSTGMEMYSVPVDWEGWKLVEVNLDDLYEARPGLARNDISMIRFNINGYSGFPIVKTWSEESYVCLDTIYLSKTKRDPLEFTGTNPGPGRRIRTLSPVITMEFNSYLARLSRGAISFSRDDQVVDFTLSQNADMLSIMPLENLEYDTTYTVSINAQCTDSLGQRLAQEQTLTFQTMAAGLQASVPVIASEGNTFSASAQAANDSSETKNVTLALSVYDQAGNAVDFVTETKELAPGEEAELYAQSIQGETAKAMVYDENCHLLSDGFAAYPPNVPVCYETASEAEEITLEARVNLSTLSVSGTAQGAENLLLVVYNLEKEVMRIEPFALGQDGAFSADLPFDMESGIYTVQAVSDEKTSQEVSISVLSQEDQALLCQSINQAETLEETWQIVTENQALLSLEDGDASTAITLLYEQKPFSSYEALLSMLDIGKSLMSKANTIGWEAMTQWLEENSSLLMKNVSAYTKYQSYSNKEKNQINTSLVAKAPFDDLEDFRDQFADAVDAYEGSSSTGGGGSGSGGSGGGGSSSGRGSSSSGGGYTLPNPTQQTPDSEQPQTAFEDLENYQWAQESIALLLEKNIVTMSQDGAFRPQDAITREEFVKLLVEALDISHGAAQFGDVSGNEWFAPYVGGAQEAGIVLGDAQGNFGVGENITRQDMVTMILRALSQVGKELPQEEEAVEFTDASSIAPYALEAVEKMSRAGIITGMEDGRFAPEEYADRAQAAVMIARLLQV